MNDIALTPASGTADSLLSVAHRLFLERGYSAVSYADLAAEVGIRKASIHYHFPTKTDLGLAVIRAYRKRAHQAGLALLASLPDTRSRLEVFIGNWAACMEGGTEPICLAVVLSSELNGLPAPIATEVHQHFTDLAATIARSLQADGWSGTAASVRAESIVALLHGAMVSARARSQPALFRAIAGDGLTTLLA